MVTSTAQDILAAETLFDKQDSEYDHKQSLSEELVEAKTYEESKIATTIKRKMRKSNEKSSKRGSLSPRGKLSHRKSKSPDDKCIIIKNGKVILVNKRDEEAFQRLQFPIRKSNYDNRTVESMLLNLDNFRASVNMMEKMK